MSTKSDDVLVGASSPMSVPRGDSELGLDGASANKVAKSPAKAVFGASVLSVENGDHQSGTRVSGGSPLGMDDLLAAPDFQAHERVLSGIRDRRSDNTGATAQATVTTSTQEGDLTTKVGTDTVAENSAMAAMLLAGAAMIQSYQTSAKSEESEREATLSGYEVEMDSEASHQETEGDKAYDEGKDEGWTTIVGSVASMAGTIAGSTVDPQNLQNSSMITRLLADTGQGQTGLLSALGQVTSSAGKIGGSYEAKLQHDQQADETLKQKAATVFQSYEQNAQSYRDTFLQTQSSVISALQTVVQDEGTALDSAASGKA